MMDAETKRERECTLRLHLKNSFQIKRSKAQLIMKISVWVQFEDVQNILNQKKVWR